MISSNFQQSATHQKLITMRDGHYRSIRDQVVQFSGMKCAGTVAETVDFQIT